MAGTCSGKTGGSTSTLIWTGSSYTCAYTDENDDNGISGWKTETRTSCTPQGYTEWDDCRRDSCGNVDISGPGHG